MTYTLKVQIDPKGYTDYLEKIFKYGYKMKREMVNYFNRQEYRRQSSDDYKYLAEETKTLNELQEKIKETKDKELKKALKAEYKEKSDELKEGSEKDLLELESKYIAEYNATDHEFGYNTKD